MAAFVDKVTVQAEGVGQLDRFTTIDLTSDMVGPYNAAFEMGDDGSWEALGAFAAHGQKTQVKVNGATQMTGKVVLNDSPSDAANGTNVRFAVVSKIHEAMLASADPDIRVKDATLLDVVLAAYEGLGMTVDDFIYKQDIARKLATGKSVIGSPPIKGLEAYDEKAARVAPPESIHMFVDRHLRRFGFIHWDAPDGRIVIGTVDDTQAPTFYFRHFIGPAGRENNVISISRNKDWSEIPSVLGVFGVGGKAGFRKSKVRSVVEDQDLVDAGFYRPVLIIADGIKDQAQAERAAAREMSARRKVKDTWSIKVDGFSQAEGGGRAVFGVDTVCDVVSNLIGGPAGAYYLVRSVLHLSASDGATAEITAIKKGLWVI